MKWLMITTATLILSGCSAVPMDRILKHAETVSEQIATQKIKEIDDTSPLSPSGGAATAAIAAGAYLVTRFLRRKLSGDSHGKKA